MDGYGYEDRYGGPPLGGGGFGAPNDFGPTPQGFRGRGAGPRGGPPMSGRGGPPMGRGGVRGGGPGGPPLGHGAPPRGAASGGYQPVYGGFGADFGANFEQPSPLDAEVEIVTREMHNEVNILDQSGEYGEQLKNARRLLITEVERLENNIDPEWLEVDVEKPIRLIRKVLVPTFRNPRFNYVGKVLGPKGATLQNIARQFKCHVYVLGRGSTRDRKQEEELLNSGDPAYAHYAGPLHVKIETSAPPTVAYQRVASVLEVLRQLLQPVKDTVIPGITDTVDEGKSKSQDEEKNDEKSNSQGSPTKSAEVNKLKPQPKLQNAPQNGGSSGGRGGGGFGSRGGRGAPSAAGRGGGFVRGGGRGGPPGRGGPRGGGPMRRGGGGGARPGFAPY